VNKLLISAMPTIIISINHNYWCMLTLLYRAIYTYVTVKSQWLSQDIQWRRMKNMFAIKGAEVLPHSSHTELD